MGRNLYICVEGLDGSGKDSQLDMLCQWMTEEGLGLVRVAEPDEQLPTGRLLRQLLRTGEHPETYAALFLADRIALQTHKVKPALQAGKSVVSSRSFVSTLVYQQDNWPLDWLQQLHAYLPAKPDVILYVMTPPDICFQRMSQRDRELEVFETPPAMEKAAERYLWVLQQLPPWLLAPGGQVVIVDGTGTMEEVHALVKASLTPLIKGTE